MFNLATPKPVRFLVMLSAAFLIASLLISGINAYVALASAPQAPYVPSTVGFEGQLTDGTGTPVTNGNYTIVFSLYSASSGGTAIWTESQTVAVSGGLYSVQLGSTTSIPATAFDGVRWLGVKVGSDAEMTPRIPISAVPFALNARQAQGLQGYNVLDSAPSNNNSLFWSSANSRWEPRAGTVPDLAAVGNNANPQNFLANYRSGAVLSYEDANTIKVSAGELMVDGLMRRNTSSVNIGFTSGGLNLGLDSGSGTSNTIYYVYAVADNTSTSNFELSISTNSSAPSGKIHYRKLGWFRTRPGSSQIDGLANLPAREDAQLTILWVDPTQNTITNSTTETTVFSAIVPGGTLAKGNMIRLSLLHDLIQNTGAGRTVTFRVKFGGTTVITDTHSPNASQYSQIIWNDVVIIGNDATGAQRVDYQFIINERNNESYRAYPWTATSSIDSTVDQLLEVTIQLGFASTLFTFNTQGGYLIAP